MVVKYLFSSHSASIKAEKRFTAEGLADSSGNPFFVLPDGKEDWIIYHANAFAGQGCSDTRSPRMQKFTWNADGTPNFGQPVVINTNIPRPSGEPAN